MDVEKRLSPQDALPLMTDILSKGSSFRLLVTGNSMLPFLRHQQDAVILTPVSQSVRPGDILFYLRTPQTCILHRVHQIDPDGRFLMCGDSQTALELIHSQQILARVSHVERSGKLCSCSRWDWRLQSTLWRLLKPVRPYLLALLRKLKLIHYAVLD